MRFVVIPKRGVETDGQLLRLGSTREEVTALFGEPDSVQGIAYYFDAELALDFGKDGTLRYIECRSGTNAVIYGTDVFGTGADKLHGILAAENGTDIDEPEEGHSYTFNEIRVSLWRETSPQDVEEMIEEAENDGEPMTEDDIEDERQRAAHFDTIGVFAPGYYG